MELADFIAVIVTFVIWSGLCAWLVSRRASRLTLRQLFVIVTGFGLIAAFGSPSGQEFLRTHRWVSNLLGAGSVIAFVVTVGALAGIALHRIRPGPPSARQ
jgi:hypothetical protein